MYFVPVLGREYRVDASKQQIIGPAQDPFSSNPEFELLLLHYLLQVRDSRLSGKWISEKQLPGGNLFFQGPHRLQDKALLERFGADGNAFLEAAGRLGAEPLKYGDISFSFRVLPGIPVASVLWVEDEEFPARLNFLFDSSLSGRLPLDVVLALVKMLVQSLLAN